MNTEPGSKESESIVKKENSWSFRRRDAHANYGNDPPANNRSC